MGVFETGGMGREKKRKVGFFCIVVDAFRYTIAMYLPT